MISIRIASCQAVVSCKPRELFQLSLHTYRAILRRELVLLGRFYLPANAVDPDRVRHGAAVKAALVRIPGQHPEAVWKRFDGALVCCVPTGQVVNEKVASIDEGEAAEGGSGQELNQCGASRQRGRAHLPFACAK